MVPSAMKSIPNVCFIIKTNATLYSGNIKVNFSTGKTFFCKTLHPFKRVIWTKKRRYSIALSN